MQFVAVVKQNLPCFPYPNIYLLFLEKQISVLVHQQLGDTRSQQGTSKSLQMVFGPAPLISQTEALTCIWNNHYVLCGYMPVWDIKFHFV